MEQCLSESEARASMTQRDAKELRAQIQKIADEIQSFAGRSRERSLVVTKLEEAKMWLGKELGNLGGEDLNAKRDAEELSDSSIVKPEQKES